MIGKCLLIGSSSFSRRRERGDSVRRVQADRGSSSFVGEKYILFRKQILCKNEIYEIYNLKIQNYRFQFFKI